MDFLTGVNRLLRINQIISGDDDSITSFDDTQHAADIELAQIAIQDELSYFVSGEFIPYERASSTVALVTGQQSYSLASDFVRFWGQNPSFYDSTDNTRIYEFPGGEDALKDTDYQYQTTRGGPAYWYWVSTTTKKVGFYNVPDSSYNGRSLSYEYEMDVSVTSADDTLPFQSLQEAWAFIACAARRFKIMDGSLPVTNIEEDPIYNSSKATLLGLIKPTNASKSYGRSY